MSSGNRNSQQLLQFQPEQYLSILRGVCAANWLALAMLATIFIVSGVWPLNNPTIGFLFAFVAVEHISANLILTLALKYRGWLQKTPRQALNRLRQLTALVLAWGGLHVLGAFDLFGGLQGPMAAMLPILGLIAFIILPRSSAAWACAIWYCSILLLIGLQAAGIIIPLPDLLDESQVMALQSKPVFALVLSGISIASVIFAYRLVHGLGFHDQGSNRLFDPRFNCFSLECWHQRLQDELTRSYAQNSTTSIVILGLKAHEADTQSIDFDELTFQLQGLAAAALTRTRQDLDTVTYIGNGRFAVLLPTANQEKCIGAIGRIQSYFPDAELVKLSNVAPQKPNDALLAALLKELSIPAVANIKSLRKDSN
ncbi:MAG: hypothetical protein ACSHXK_15895 [Oceanococcus sp.]